MRNNIFMNKVSVIIPVYNVESFLKEAIESILNQSFENIEVIIINDGSTDASENIINSYLGYDNIIYHKQENSGLSSARNKGLELSTGEYILYFDSDDILAKDCIKTCFETMTKNNLDIVFFNATEISENGKPLNSNKYIRGNELYSKKKSSFDFFNQSISVNKYIVSACLYMHRRSKFLDLKFKEGIIHEDNHYTTSLLLNNDVSVGCLKDEFFIRRNRKNSIMNCQKSLKNIDGYLFSANYFSIFLKICDERIKHSLSCYIIELLLASISSYRKSAIKFLPYKCRIKIIKTIHNMNGKYILNYKTILFLFPEPLKFYKK